MAYSEVIKLIAANRRKLGHSIKEISRELSISVSTASIWLKGVELDDKAIQRLESRKIIGRNNSIKTIKKRSLVNRQMIDKDSKDILNQIIIDRNVSALLCSILYWAEGGKTESRVSFTNSDPKMISTFLMLFRNAYSLDERKFRCLVHVHEYHDEEKIRRYWSKITGIPIAKFHRSYLKPHTKIRIKDGYKGTVTVNYYDSQIALKIKSLYNMLSMNLGV